MLWIKTLRTCLISQQEEVTKEEGTKKKQTQNKKRAKSESPEKVKE